MGGVKTPTLILHSEEDYRCPMEQDEQLFTALMKLGVPTEFVRFPNEPHGLSRTGKPKHRVERLQHIVRWFDRYLKGEE
jgi:dipeptidyl aminopeptidase/acylaminoacyl peptidase